MKDTHKWTPGKIAMITINCILCLTIVVSGMVFFIDNSRINSGSFPQNDNNVPVDSSDTDPQNNEKQVLTARLMCAGDNLIQSNILTQARQRGEEGGYDFSYAYEGLRKVISMSNIAFINQESVFDTSAEPSGDENYNSPTELLDEMIDVGFDVFNQSNNHIMDKDIFGIQNNLALFDSRQNILLTGLYNTREDMLTPQVREVNGIRIAFVGFTEYLNDLVVPDDCDIGLVYLTDSRFTQSELYGTMKLMIENAKAAADVVCVSMHWQNENISEPDHSQRVVTEKLLEYGADVIIGTGPQVLQPVEYMENGDGEEALVLWSLGNVISSKEDMSNLLGGVAEINFEKDSTTGKTKVTSAYIIPTITHYEADFANIRVIPLHDYTEELASQHGVQDENFTYNYINDYYSDMYGDKLKINYNN